MEQSICSVSSESLIGANPKSQWVINVNYELQC